MHRPGRRLAEHGRVSPLCRVPGYAESVPFPRLLVGIILLSFPAWQERQEGEEMLDMFGDFPVAVSRLRNGLFGAHLDRFAEVLAERGYAKFSAW
jgi:hypothetical protein